MSNTANRRRTLIAWSTGKDSAWTLHVLRRDPSVEVVGLFSTVNAKFERVTMHGVRVDLLRPQAAQAGLPLDEILIPFPCSDDEYGAAMARFIDQAKERGIEAIAFGDLFLEDVRAYREEKLAGTGIQPLFPLWGLPTDTLAREMIDDGLRATITCVDTKILSPEWVGREYDQTFLAQLPESVDPCGERGEFHTFVSDGPMFQQPVNTTLGEVVTRDGHAYIDLVPQKNAASELPITQHTDGIEILRR